jgi:TPR repeat protein
MSSATNELPSAAAAGAVHADKAVGAPASTNELLLAATRGDRVAQYRLAQASDQGLGVPTNAVEAVNWYRTAAEQGYAEAEFKLGTLLHSGGDGLVRDEAGAVSWYRKAADQGFAGAEFALGICYGHGEGVPTNIQMAVQWIEKAAEQGLPRAQYLTGKAYEKGFAGCGGRQPACRDEFEKPVAQADGRADFHGEGPGVALFTQEIGRTFRSGGIQVSGGVRDWRPAAG